MTLHPPPRLAAGPPPAVQQPRHPHLPAMPASPRRPRGQPSTYVDYMCRLATVKLTGPLERVLRVMITDPTAPHYGYDLMKAAKLPSGTLYPMLARLQQEGLVDSEWEAQRQDAGGRPPRKYYRLTGEGPPRRPPRACPGPSSASRRVAPGMVRRGPRQGARDEPGPARPADRRVAHPHRLPPAPSRRARRAVPGVDRRTARHPGRSEHPPVVPAHAAGAHLLYWHLPGQPGS